MSLEAIVLLILFILVAALLLYYYIRHRHLLPSPLPFQTSNSLRRQISPDASSSSAGLRLHPLPHSAAAPLHSSSSRRRQVSPAPPSSSAGLPLPRFKFSDLTRPGSVTVTGDCAICLSEFEPDDDLRLLPLCLHAFHVECIDTWLAGESRICPICRAEIFRSDSDLLRATASGGSFRLAIGNVSRGRRPDAAAISSSRVHSLSGGELEYIVDQEWELLMLPVPDGGEEGENVAVVIDGQAPSADTSEYQSSHGMVFTGSSRRWTDLSAVFEALSRWLS